MKKTLAFRMLSSLVLLLVMLLMLSGYLDRVEDKYTEQGFKRALITFAVARGINGVISVAQETEVSLQPAGVGMTILPGQILDPVNDLIERFSWVMLVSSTSLGFQKIFSSIIAWPVFSYLLAVWLLFMIVLIWIPEDIHTHWWGKLLKVTVVSLLIRFLIPMMALSSEMVYQFFLESNYEQSLNGLQLAHKEVEEMHQTGQGDVDSLGSGNGLIERAKAFVSSARDSMNVKQRMQELREVATQASEHAINLTVVFLFQTILFPFLFIWVMVSIIKRVFRWI